eukprot:CAMPEP_0171575544 /NCGR_PEP_ID=MMETSP0961-20121227/6055_1 /TAXON_ID=87120 /ORGANISM="Aurantiochytrium limacinum, Strain ATCCMYA-1381" /LENGTH=152 /DNA_ID=CAMNT_0012131149 /DNA_START=1107 /DNA_END=1562 /DNA_ORIENTATION=-
MGRRAGAVSPLRSLADQIRDRWRGLKGLSEQHLEDLCPNSGHLTKEAPDSHGSFLTHKLACLSSRTPVARKRCRDPALLLVAAAVSMGTRHESAWRRDDDEHLHQSGSSEWHQRTGFTGNERLCKSRGAEADTAARLGSSAEGLRPLGSKTL